MKKNISFFIILFAQFQIAMAQGPCLIQQDLIVNGSFENGPTGYNSDAQQVVNWNPNNMCIYSLLPDIGAISGNHSGTAFAGNVFMAADADQCADPTTLWSQQVNLTPGTTYAFTIHATDLSNFCDISLDQVQLTLNGVAIPGTLTAMNAGAGVWNTISASITPSNTVNVLGVQLLINNSCGDVGLDDISLITTTQLPLPVNTTTVAETCAGNCDGSATVTTTLGTGPFTITLISSTGTFFNQVGNVPLIFNGLCGDVYTVSITSSEGCQGNGQVTIIAAPELDAFLTTSGVACLSNCDGEIEVTVSTGSDVLLTFNLIDANGTTIQTSQSGSPFTFTDLCAGVYQVQIVTKAGCIVTLDATIEACMSCEGVYNPAPIDKPIADQSCYWSTGGNSGNTIGGANQLGTTEKFPLRISTDNTERIRVQEDGFVGINTITPGNRLEINSAIDCESGLRFTELNCECPTRDNNGKVLSVDCNGDVVLVDDLQGSSIGITNNCTSILNLPKSVDAQGNLTCSQIFDYGLLSAFPANTVGVYVGGNTNPSGLTGDRQTLYVAGNQIVDGAYYLQKLNHSFKALSVEGGNGTSNLLCGLDTGPSLPGASNANNTGNVMVGLEVANDESNGSIVSTDIEYCTFVGNQAAFRYEGLIPNPTTGDDDGHSTFVGSQSGFSDKNGGRNTFIGSKAGYLTNGTSSKTNGDDNTFIGTSAGYYNTIGYRNIGIGINSGPATSSLFNSTAIGYNVLACASNSMVFGNGSVNKWGFGTCVTVTNAALQVGTTSANGNGAYLTTGGVWTDVSDQNLKEDITDLDKHEVLKKIDELSVTKWMYKGTDKEYHIGPMAQDFQKQFNIGDGTSIAAADKAGVALIGIQALNETVQEQKQQIENLTAKLEEYELALSQCCLSYEKAIESVEGKEDKASLQQNAPNPFSEKTSIRYYLTENFKKAEITVYSLGGELLKTYSLTASGNGQVDFDGNTFSSGTYIYAMIVDGVQIDSKWMTLTR